MPKKPPLKPNTYRIYLNEEGAKLLNEGCDKTELGQTELLSRAVLAALRTLKKEKFQFTLPIKFVLVETDEQGPVPGEQA